MGAALGFSAGLLAAAGVPDSVSLAAVESLAGVAVESLAGAGAALSELTGLSAPVAVGVSVDFGASVVVAAVGVDVAGADVGVGALLLGTLPGLAVAGWGAMVGGCAGG